MQIETYNPEFLNLNEFIDFYNIDMILNNNLINLMEFELLNYDEQLNQEIKNTIEELEDDLDLLEDLFNYYYCGVYTFQELQNMEPTAAIRELTDAITDYSSERIPGENYQYFIINNNDVDLFKKYLPSYDLFYNDDADLYLLGVGHWGMSWSFFFSEAPRPEHMRIKKYDEILNHQEQTTAK